MLEEEAPHPQPVRRWLSPLTSQRPTRGQFHAHFCQLRECPETFFAYLRMSVSSYSELLEVVRSDLRRRDTVMRSAISPEERLVVTLRYLATGNSFSSLRYEFLMGVSTIRTIVKETCQILWNRLQSHEMPSPTQEIWEKASEGFWRSTHFPNCVGALAGKHIRVRRPTKSASTFTDKEKHIALLAVVDSGYKFIVIELGGYKGESYFLRRSRVCRCLSRGSLCIPPNKSPPGSQSAPLPHVFAATRVFLLSKSMMPPYNPEGDLSIPQKIFNYRQSKAGRPLQSAFGILAKKWKIFLKPIPLAVDFAVIVVKCACVLHNYVIKRDGYVLEDTLEDPIPDMPAQFSYEYPDEMDRRETFASYFTSPEGEIPMQYEEI